MFPYARPVLSFVLSCGSFLVIACPVPLLALCYGSFCPYCSFCPIARPVILLVLPYYSSCPITRPSLIALPFLLHVLSFLACPVLLLSCLYFVTLFFLLKSSSFLAVKAVLSLFYPVHWVHWLVLFFSVLSNSLNYPVHCVPWLVLFL